MTQKMRLETKGFVIAERVLGRALRERLAAALGEDGACRMAPWVPPRLSRARAPETAG